MSNGPTESINNLIKRIKRIGFGFRRFANYRIRVLLYASTPNWDLLDTVTLPDPCSTMWTAPAGEHCVEGSGQLPSTVTHEESEAVVVG